MALPVMRALPVFAGATLEPDLFETCGVRGLRGVNVNAELFAGRDAGGSFVGGGAAEAGGLGVGFVGAKGDQVEAEHVGEGGLELIDLGVEFEEKAGLGLRVESCWHATLSRRVEGLAIDRGERLRDWQGRSCTGISTRTAERSASIWREASCEPLWRGCTFTRRSRSEHARVDVHTAVEKEAVVRRISR